MKAVKKDVKHYYKIIEGYFDDFEQTPLTQNGNLGGDSFAVTGWGGNYSGTPYNAVYPQTGNYSAYSKGGQPGVTFNLYTPKPTIITGYSYGAYWNAGGVYVSLQGSNDNSTWTYISPQTWRALGEQSVTFDNYTPYQYYLFYVLTTGGGTNDGVNVYRVRLYGKEYSYSNEEVFDPHFVETKYYKYFDHGFVAPYLTYNGTMGKDKFAAKAITEYSSSYQAYMAFDNSTSSQWASSGTQNPSWISFYNPKPLKVSSLEMRNRTSAENFTGGSVYGSNNNTTWNKLCDYSTTITSANAYWNIPVNSPDFYNYYKIEGTSMTGTNQGFTDIGILAQEREVVETNQSEYKHYNIREIGTLTNNDGILSGFSSGNYAKLPNVFSHGSNSWEVQFKVTTGSDVSTQSCICEQQYNGNYYGLTIYIQSGTLRVRCGNGSSNFWDVNTDYSISANTTYWIKAEFNGTQYILSASIDGENWTTASTISSTTIATDNYSMNIGKRNYSGYSYEWLGSIDLNESYIKVNNELWWQGTDVLIITDPITEADFSEDVYNYNTTKIIPSYKIQKELTERKYWKYGTTYIMPNMTSANTPSGTVTLLNGSDYNSKQPWQLFNSEVANDWVHPSSSTYSVRYTFDEPLIAGEGSISGYYSSDDPKGGYYSSRYLDSYTAIANFIDGTTQVLDEWNGHSNNTLHLENTYNVVKDITSIDFIFKGTVDLTFGCLYNFKVTHTPVSEGTPSDYDFYTGGRHYYKYGNNYIDTNYIPLMTSTTLPSGSVINTGSLEIYGDTTAYGAWGKNQTKRQEWTSNSNISTTYIPASNIPSGHYKLNFQLANYGHWSTWLTVKFTLTYSDDVTEDIYTASSGFPPTRSDDQSVYFDYSQEFITSKPIKSIKFSGTSQIGNEGSGCVRNIYIQEIEIVEATEQDYDFYIDSNKYLAIKSYEKGQYYGGI